MSANFNPALPTPLDRVRQKIGDTDVSAAQVEDETIQTYLTDFASCPDPILKTAWQLAVDLAAKWAKFGTTTLDDQQQRSESVYKHYLEMARKFEVELTTGTAAAGSTGAIIVTGLNDCRGPIEPNPWDCAL